jgi:hypothetical protein
LAGSGGRARIARAAPGGCPSKSNVRRQPDMRYVTPSVLAILLALAAVAADFETYWP